MLGRWTLTMALVMPALVASMGVHQAGAPVRGVAASGGRVSSGSVDPCLPTPCGPNTRCSIDQRGVGVCHCLDGFFPKPDTITGCGPQCVRDSECGTGYVCRRTLCVRASPSYSAPAGAATSSHGSGGTAFRNTATTAGVDPCSLGLCGTNANCDPVRGRAVCSCPEGYEGNPLSACNKGECIADSDCPAQLSCLGVRCVNPCGSQPCGSGAECNVKNRRAICTCPRGYSGDPLTACAYDPKQTGGGSSHTSSGSVSTTQYADACRPSPCGDHTNCRVKQGRAVCSCIQNYIGDPLTRCRPECASDAECAAHQVCTQSRCRNACTGACGSGARCEAVNHRAICTCPQYYRGSGLTGCYPECTSHGECGSTQACIQLRCGDPCSGACGIGANCRVVDHTAICSCPVGYSGHPYDRCLPPAAAVGVAGGSTSQQVPVHGGSATGAVSQAAGVFVSGTSRPGAQCSPNPCGAQADCTPGYKKNGEPRPVCTCPKGYLGDPLTACERGECLDHTNCLSSQACYNYQCTDPCISESGSGVCGVNAICRPERHQGVCSCPSDFTGDPLTQCSRKPLATVDHRV